MIDTKMLPVYFYVISIGISSSYHSNIERLCEISNGTLNVSISQTDQKNSAEF